MAVWVGGCGGSTANPSGLNPVSCDTTDVATICTVGQVCESLAGPLADADVARSQTECVGYGGTFEHGPCPTAGRVGGCVDGDVLFAYYPTPQNPLKASNVTAMCASFKGTYCP
jgi:hypothetical protein